jgi:hypothetical protein
VEALFDPVVAVFAGCDGPLLACNSGCGPGLAETPLHVTAGEVYLISAGDSGGEQGGFTLTLAPVSGDTCVNEALWDTCAGDAAFAQFPADSVFGFSDLNAGTALLDNFVLDGGVLAALSWWELQFYIGETEGALPDACVAQNYPHRVTIHEAAGVYPGVAVCSYDLAPRVIAMEAGDGVLSLHLQANLSPPCEVSAGWVRIEGDALAADCQSALFLSHTGDADHFTWISEWLDSEGEPEGSVEFYSPGNGDVALCLYEEAFPAEGEGEGEGEGMPCPRGPVHTADQNASYTISLNELLRIIQFYNAHGFGCQAGTEDGFAPVDSDRDCCPHDSDYHPDFTPSWTIDLTELLRLIQFFNSGGYHHCPASGTEDTYCPGPG